MTATDATLDTERFPGYEAKCPWHHRQPFGNGEPYPRVITRDQANYMAWAPDESVNQPVWAYVSTHKINAGTFYVQPKEWFDPGNHPNPEPYYCTRGTLLLANPDTGGVIEINAGDAANIPALAYHIAYNFGDEEAEIVWFVPAEMHTEEWKERIHLGQGKWYDRDPVTLNGTHNSNEGFPSHLDHLNAWPSATPIQGPLDMQHLPKSTWLNLFEGTDQRKMMLTSIFYADDQIRCARHLIPRYGETKVVQGDYERVLYVVSGTLSVNLPDTGQGLLARSGDMAFMPPNTRHGLQAIDDEPVTLISAIVW